MSPLEPAVWSERQGNEQTPRPVDSWPTPVTCREEGGWHVLPGREEGTVLEAGPCVPAQTHFHPETACSETISSVVQVRLPSFPVSALEVKTQGPLATGNGQAFSESPSDDHGRLSHRCPELWLQPGPSRRWP